MSSTPRPGSRKKTRTPRSRGARSEIPQAPPAFPSIPVGTHLASQLDRAPIAIARSPARTRHTPIPEGPEPQVAEDGLSPRDLQAVAAGLGCIAALAVGTALVGVVTAFTLWSGWTGH
ncbi:MAG: hypothetical protein AAGA48_06265 [Myxococcota bacterium]